MQEKSYFSSSPEGMHRIVYYDYGSENKKTILCVHGLARFGRDFEYLANDLVGHGFRVIAPDIVGRGKSDRFESHKNYDYDQYLVDIWGLLEKENIKELDCWIGTSMGGVLGILAFNQHPKRIKSLILNDIGPYIPDQAFEYIEKFLTINEPNDNWEEFYELFKKRMKTFAVRDDDAMLFLAKISALHLNDDRVGLNYDTNVVNGLFYTYEKRDTNHMWEEWKNINCPILVLRGEHSFFFLDKTVEQMKQTNSNMDLITIYDCGHAPSLTSDDQITPIREWLLKQT